MKRAAFLSLFLLSATAPVVAYADCADYWFTRNLIFDRAGYCFGSPLGQAVFDNSDCTTKSPALAAPDKAAVARLRENEADARCQINTQSRVLNLPDLAFRKQLQTIPVPLPRNSAAGCIGWKAAAQQLHNGADQRFAVTGVIQPGDNVYFNYEGLGAWSYVSTERAAGWAYIPRLDNAICGQIIP